MRCNCELTELLFVLMDNYQSGDIYPAVEQLTELYVIPDNCDNEPEQKIIWKSSIRNQYRNSFGSP